MTIRRALDRTILLIRDEIAESVSDDVVLAAVTGTRIALVADAENLASHSAQSAFVTAGILMARSGHAVHLFAPDVPMVAAQLPLGMGSLVTELLKAGVDLMPGATFATSDADAPFDLAVALGDSASSVASHRCIRLNATDWSGLIEAEPAAARWQAADWPLGGLAAATLAAGEAFKCAMHKLAFGARNPARMQTVFATFDHAAFHLAPDDTPITGSVGAFDCISGGAIIHAALYVLARLPRLSGYARVVEPDTADLSNLNRYALLLRSTSHLAKAQHLAELFSATGLTIDPLDFRFDAKTRMFLRPAPAVLVGVDDIPTRWEVQRAKPDWLAVGATTHWSAMSSFHAADLGCAECAHPYDDPGNDRIPTVAFVSFWAGLLTVTYFLRHLSGAPTPAREQQVFLTPFRPENVVRSIVPIRHQCPSCSAASQPVLRKAGNDW